MIETLGSGGAERSLVNYLSHAEKDALEHVVVQLYPSRSKFNKYRDQISNLGIEIIELKFEKKYQIFTKIAALVKIINYSNADIIVTHLYWANIIGRVAGKLAGIKVTSFLHNPDYENSVTMSFNIIKKFKHKLAMFIDYLTCRICCDMLIAVSEYTKKKSTFLIGDSNLIEVIYNPIELIEKGKFSFDKLKQLKSKDRVLLQAACDTGQLIVSVGRVTWQKGHDFLIDAFHKVYCRHPKACLIIVGKEVDTSFSNKIRSKIQKLDLQKRVFLLGEQKEVKLLLKKSNLFIFPSRYEGMGMALVEAMFEKLPVIASNVGPISEIIIHQENGVLVEADNVTELSDIMSQLLSSPSERDRLGRNGYYTAKEKFNLNDQVKKLSNFLTNLVER